MHSHTHTHTAHAQAQSQVHTPVPAYANVYTHSALQRVAPGGGRVRAGRSRCPAQAGRSSGRGGGLAAGQLSPSARLGLCGNTLALVHPASALCVFKGLCGSSSSSVFLTRKGRESVCSGHLAGRGGPAEIAHVGAVCRVLAWGRSAALPGLRLRASAGPADLDLKQPSSCLRPSGPWGGLGVPA